jgi:septum formation protein
MKLILASASPRRAELLEEAGIAFEVYAAEVDERVLPDETPMDMVARLAVLKAETVAARFSDQTVLAADTVVVLDGEPLGKPVDADHAKAMLRRLSGRAHEVMTGFSLVRPGSPVLTRTVTTKVFFRELRDADIDRYVASGIPLDKAGAYGIQADTLCMVTKIEGSYSNVVGLPMVEVLVALHA